MTALQRIISMAALSGLLSGCGHLVMPGDSDRVANSGHAEPKSKEKPRTEARAKPVRVYSYSEPKKPEPKKPVTLNRGAERVIVEPDGTHRKASPPAIEARSPAKAEGDGQGLGGGGGAGIQIDGSNVEGSFSSRVSVVTPPDARSSCRLLRTGCEREKCIAEEDVYHHASAPCGPEGQTQRGIVRIHLQSAIHHCSGTTYEAALRELLELVNQACASPGKMSELIRRIGALKAARGGIDGVGQRSPAEDAPPLTTGAIAPATTTSR